MWKKTHRNLKNGSEKFPLKVLKGILYDFQRNASKYYYILQNNSLYRYYYSYHSYYSYY